MDEYNYQYDQYQNRTATRQYGNPQVYYQDRTPAQNQELSPYIQQPTYPSPQQPQPQYFPVQQRLDYSMSINNPVNKILSVGDWIVTFLLMSIPGVSLVMLIVWLASSDTPQSKKNYLIACIIFWVIIYVLLAAILSILIFIFGISIPIIGEMI